MRSLVKMAPCHCSSAALLKATTGNGRPQKLPIPYWGNTGTIPVWEANGLWVIPIWEIPIPMTFYILLQFVFASPNLKKNKLRCAVRLIDMSRGLQWFRSCLNQKLILLFPVVSFAPVFPSPFSGIKSVFCHFGEMVTSLKCPVKSQLDHLVHLRSRQR